MMFGVRGAEEIGGGFMSGLFLAAAPVHEEAVAEAAEHPHHPHGLGFEVPAKVVPVPDVQRLAEAVLNAPDCPVGLETWGGAQGLGRQTGEKRYGFREVRSQIPARQGRGGRCLAFCPNHGLQFGQRR